MAAVSSSMPTFAKRLQGKVALITGGASGIGEATARLFARNGAKVVLADIQSDLGKTVSEQITSESGEQVSYVHCNVTKEADVENAVNTAITMHGKLYIMFNNAGIGGKLTANILENEPGDFKNVLDVNLVGAFLGAKHAARVMIPRKKGSILFTSSVASVCYGRIPHAYTASKHGIVGLTKNIAVELGKHGIRVNCISPYGVPTPLTTKSLGLDIKGIEDTFYAIANLKEASLGADDIAEAALYMGSDESKYVSGLNLVVDGGYNLRNVVA